MPPERAGAFAPGRVNLIGEHTDYNGGLALPFAISQGITVHGEASGERRISADALDLGERDEFALEDRSPAGGWRAFVHGAVAELSSADFPPPGARLRIGGDLPAGAGLSSSAALEVALCLALLALAGGHALDGPAPAGEDAARGLSRPARGLSRPARGLSRLEIARLCARVENDWVGAQTGLLDQLASLFGEADRALRIDFATLQIDPVPLRLGDWRLVVLDSGERHSNASGGYNERRAECARACELLGVRSLSEASAAQAEGLPEPLRLRALHVLGENRRVNEAIAALRDDDLHALGALLSASHESLRDRYEISTPTVEATVARLLQAGAAGARIMGGGFGGCVLGLFDSDARPPEGAHEVRSGAGAHLLAP